MMEDDEKAMEAPDGPGPEFEEVQQHQQGAEGGDMVEQMIQAKNDRKRAESDVQLLANRLAHLKVRELNGSPRAAAPPPRARARAWMSFARCACCVRTAPSSSTDLLPLACMCPNPPFVGKTQGTLHRKPRLALPPIPLASPPSTSPPFLSPATDTAP
jgi:hypothetical protein